MNTALLLRLVMRRPVAGMKLDARNQRQGIRPVVRQAVAMLGLMIVAPGGVSADVLANLPDPTRPAYNFPAAAGAAARPMGPALQSTFISASQRRAVINGKTYVMGDKYGGGTIIDIQSYEVVLKKANSETRLRLLPKLAKQTHMVKVPTGGEEGGKK